MKNSVNIAMNSIIGLLVATAMTFSVNAVAQDARIPAAVLAINESGPWAGSFDELLHELTADFVYSGEGAVIKKLGFQGPFTVFAPTDGAFKAVKQVLACNGLSLSDVPDIRRATLQYHAASGAFLAEDVVAVSDLEMLSGQMIMQDGGVITDVAGQQINILATDILVDNGVVHVIDTVMLPADLGLNACGS